MSHQGTQLFQIINFICQFFVFVLLKHLTKSITSPFLKCFLPLASWTLHYMVFVSTYLLVLSFYFLDAPSPILDFKIKE